MARPKGVKNKKTVTKKTPVVPVADKRYTVTLSFNGEVFSKKTDNIDDAIMAMKPDFVHTDMFLEVKDGEFVLNRHLTLVQARLLFANEINREIIISNFLN